MNLNKNVKFDKRNFIFFEALLVILCGIWYSTYKSETVKISNINNDVPNKQEQMYDIYNYDSLRRNSQGQIIGTDVHITGAVNNPGIYPLNTDNTIKDAIDAAGGFTNDADETLFNSDYFIFDAISIYVPKKGENYNNNLIEYLEEGIPSLEQEKENETVNINTADIENLIKLPGIGEKTAERIIKYRDEHGSFENIEDIKNVPRIGNSIFDEIKNIITVE